jgi:hypothetical protein
MWAAGMNRPRFSQTNPDYFLLGGGLDLLTPAITMEPGKVSSSQNYEPQIGGGYRRIDGFERFDGQDSPSDMAYWLAAVTLTLPVAVDDTITGLTSAATGIVIAQIPGYLVLGAVTGTFTNNESISNGATVGTIGLVALRGAADPSNDADYTNLAADLQRGNIDAVPGEGRIRGVWRYNDVLYAFRDNVGATAGGMYKSTSAGWVQVTFGSEIQFTNAVGEIFAGNTITGLTSGATALVVKPMLRTGTWSAAGVGTLIISTITGTWQSGEAIQVTGVTKATSSSLATAITRLPGGALDFCNANFTGSTDTKKMYGADGVNLAFEFDGTNYIPIRTGMATDAPSHVIEHKFYLHLSFRGSSQYSGLGLPYAWTSILGAGEIATGENITGYLIQSGGSSTASLAIFTEGRTYILYGSSSANFVLTPSVDDIGSFAFTAQSIGNDSMSLSNRGIQRLRTTLNYGNFEFASVSHLIQPLITGKRGLQTASTTLKTKGQYRVYFSDYSCIAVGLTGDKINGLMPLNYGIPVRCMCTAEDSDGRERTWFGSDSGYVYEDHCGTSFDGEPIESWLRLTFNTLKNPRMRKQFRAAILELTSEGFSNIDVAYDLGYGTLDVARGVGVLGQEITATGGFWDQFTWDSFAWDAQAVGNPRISLDGVEKSISMNFYSNRDQDAASVLQGITLLTTPRKLER